MRYDAKADKYFTEAKTNFKQQIESHAKSLEKLQNPSTIGFGEISSILNTPQKSKEVSSLEYAPLYNSESRYVSKLDYATNQYSSLNDSKEFGVSDVGL